jgi:5-methylcytosine-specific restriction endonuclease McrA
LELSVEWISRDSLTVLTLIIAFAVLAVIWWERLLERVRSTFAEIDHLFRYGTSRHPAKTRPQKSSGLTRNRRYSRRNRTRARKGNRPYSGRLAVPYETYLHSAEWKSIRGQVLARDGYRCQSCGARTGLQIHHLTYERRGREALGDLTVLCDACHSRAHRYGLLGVAEQRRRDQNRGGSRKGTPHAK